MFLYSELSEDSFYWTFFHVQQCPGLSHKGFVSPYSTSNYQERQFFHELRDEEREERASREGRERGEKEERGERGQRESEERGEKGIEDRKRGKE